MNKSLFQAEATFDLAPFGVNGHPAPVFRTAHGALFKVDRAEVLDPRRQSLTKGG